jgi:hypothetical protein
MQQSGGEGVNQSEYARRINVSRQAVSKMVKIGLIRLDRNGKIDPVKADRALRESQHLGHDYRRRAKLPGDTPFETPQDQEPLPSFLEAQARKEAAMAALKELELGQKRRQLFPMEDGVRLVTLWGLEIRGHLDAMDDRLPKRLAAETDWRKIKALLKKGHAEVVAKFSKMKFE